MLNGETKELPETIATVADLVAWLGLAGTQAPGIPAPGFAVELNGALAPRRRFAEQRLSEGDRIEIVTLVGGG